MKIENAIILNGANVSNAIPVGDAKLIEVINPSANNLDGSLGIQTAVDAPNTVGTPGTWTWFRNPDGKGGYTKNEVYNITTPLALSSYPLPADVCVAQWIRLVSFTGDATAATPTAQNQSAERDLLVVLK